MDLLLFGIQGSGKGTQARLLCEREGYSLFETGAELRKIAARETILGRAVKSFIDAGNLAPHEIVMQVVREAILSKPASERIIFDGIPRSLEQKEPFDVIMKEANRDFVCIHLLLPDNVAMERIRGRALAENRADDASDEFVLRRMNIFKENTLPVIDAYRASRTVIDINADLPVEEVSQSIADALATISA